MISELAVVPLDGHPAPSAGSSVVVVVLVISSKSTMDVSCHLLAIVEMGGSMEDLICLFTVYVLSHRWLASS